MLFHENGYKMKKELKNDEILIKITFQKLN